MKNAQSQPTIALVVTEAAGQWVLAETITDAEEIIELELAVLSQEANPLKRVYEHRSRQSQEDEEFADFVEELLSQPYLKQDVQEHAVQWFKSRAKIEGFQKAEADASRVIAEYAFQIYSGDSSKTDFLLSGPRAKVRIRVVKIDYAQFQKAA